MKKKALIPLLPIIPLLFMGNSPSPYPHSEHYEELSLISVEYEEGFDVDADGNHYYYAIMQISNDGDGFAEVDEIVYHNGENSVAVDSGDYMKLVRPHSEMTVKGLVHGMDTDFTNAHLTSRAYTQYEEVFFDSIKFDNMYSSEDYIDYTFQVEGLDIDENYYYSLICEYTVGSETYADITFNPYDTVTVRLNEVIDARDIEINHIYYLRGHQRGRYGFNEDSLWTLVWMLTIFLLVLGFFVSSIVVPIVIVTKKPWRKK